MIDVLEELRQFTNHIEGRWWLRLFTFYLTGKGEWKCVVRVIQWLRDQRRHNAKKKTSPPDCDVQQNFHLLPLFNCIQEFETSQASNAINGARCLRATKLRVETAMANQRGVAAMCNKVRPCLNLMYPAKPLTPVNCLGKPPRLAICHRIRVFLKEGRDKSIWWKVTFLLRLSQKSKNIN
jgi:hypothetical protein